jgi:GNAT superfamily N-acetyltransferase
MQSTGDFSCTVTGYAGFEDEIRRLRNANRDDQKTPAYVTWRYQCAADAPEPKIFWLLSPIGQRIGMAAVVFRPYWVNQIRMHVGVVGDISLDARWRGRGLGQLLLRFMTDYLDQYFPDHPAFVIPTEDARRALARVGWVTQGTLISHVFLLEPATYLRTLVRSEWIATRIAGQFRRLVHARALRRVPRGGCLRFDGDLDEALFAFSRKPRSGGAVRDLGPDSLRWRYIGHPHTEFRIARFTRGADLRGLLVFEQRIRERTCSIYDLVAETPADVESILALFILHTLSNPDIATVRVLLDDRHPFRQAVRRVGFFARRPDAVFQIHSRSGIAERVSWAVTLGDKDT